MDCGLEPPSLAAGWADLARIWEECVCKRAQRSSRTFCSGRAKCLADCRAHLAGREQNFPGGNKSLGRPFSVKTAGPTSRGKILRGQDKGHWSLDGLTGLCGLRVLPKVSME